MVHFGHFDMKDFAENNFEFDENGGNHYKMVENTAEKRESFLITVMILV